MSDTYCSVSTTKFGRSNHCHFFCILPCFPSLYSSTLQVALETVKAHQRGLRIGEVLMCNCLGLRGIQNREHLIPWNAINQGTLQNACFSFWHTQIQFILWPRGSKSLSLSFIIYNTNPSIQYCRADNCRDWPKNPLRILPAVWIIRHLAMKPFPPEGKTQVSVWRSNVKVQTISGPITSRSHVANEDLIWIKCNKQICATVGLRPLGASCDPNWE